MKLSLTLTANAGILLDFGETGPVWGIDALTDTKAPGFSCLSPEQIENVFSRLDMTPPEVLLTTHDHADHYSRKLLQKAAERYDDCRIINPWSEPEKRGKIYTINGRSIAAVPLPHRYAPQYPESDNYGFVIDAGGKKIFVPGDAEPFSEEMKELAQSFHPDAAVLPFLWITLPRCRKVLELLAPKEVVLVHLPFEEDDSEGYNRAAQKAAERFAPRAAVLNRHVQTVTFEL